MKRLDDIVERFKLELINESSSLQNVIIENVYLTADQVSSDSIFLAKSGSETHGIKFFNEAITRGAKSIVTDKNGVDFYFSDDEIKKINIPIFLLPDFEFQLGFLSAYVYDNPAKKLKVIGVTGTSGKTSTTMILFNSLLKQNFKVGLIGSNGVKINDKDFFTDLTTPQAPMIQKLLAAMVREHVVIVIMEVSSHAIELGRIVGIEFEIIAFTNLSQDHLDFHKSMENYYSVKKKLFTEQYFFKSKYKLINIIDVWGNRLYQELIKKNINFRNNIITVESISNKKEIKTDYFDNTLNLRWFIANRKQITYTKQRFLLGSNNGIKVEVNINIPGEFNVINAAMALIMACMVGANIKAAATEIETVKIKGRMDFIDIGQKYLVIIDYAHKPESLLKVLQTINKLKINKVITVIGAGGNRDKLKRPIMGKIAADNSDVVIITNDNPRFEDANKIRNEILSGIDLAKQRVKYLYDIADRKKAIIKAVSLASSTTAILIAGKGSETKQEIAGKMVEFDDYKVATRVIEQYQK